MSGPEVEDVAVRGRAPRRTWRARCSAARAPLGAPDASADAGPPPQDFSRLLGRLAPGEDPAHVEAWMRSEHGSLDQIDALHFAREVKRAVERIHARDARESDALARGYGLVPRSAVAHRPVVARTGRAAAIAS